MPSTLNKHLMSMVVHVVCDLAATCGHDSQLKTVAIEWDVPFWDVLSFGEWHMLASPVQFKQAGMKCCSPYPSPDVCMFPFRSWASLGFINWEEHAIFVFDVRRFNVNCT